MRQLLRDSFFGQIVRLASGRRLFAFEEDKPGYRAPDRYLPKHQRAEPVQSSASSGTLVETDAPNEERKKGDAEKGDAVKGKEAVDDDFIVEFEENDVDNPQHWSFGKKAFVTAMICILTTTVYMGSSIVSPATLLISEQFGVSVVAATLPLSMFVLGYAIGPLILAPLSEMPFIGRTPVYIVTLAIFVAIQIPTALTNNFGALLFCRLVAGFFGSPVLATGGATLQDIYSPVKSSNAIAIWGMAAVAGPTLGPLIGGFASQALGWRWSIWPLMIGTGAALVILFFGLPETSSSAILTRRARRLRRVTGNDKIKTRGEIEAENMTSRDILNMSLLLPIRMTTIEPIAVALNLYIALIYGLLYVWLESFAIVFQEIHGFNAGQLGLSFMGLFVGALVGVAFVLWWQRYRYERAVKRAGGSVNDVAPEIRMEMAIFGSFWIPVALIGFGLTGNFASVHWIAPIIFSALFSVGVAPVFNAVLSYLGQAYASHAASIFASNDFLRSMFGAGFPLFARAMYERLGVIGASCLLGGLGIVFIPLPILLHRYGHRLRERSNLTG